MNDISEYLLECDVNFYRNYALPAIKSNKRLFDLEGFESILVENKDIPTNQTIKDLFCRFEFDKSSQYELNPKFGRYVWDMADQWYQKWSIVFSIENMCNWMIKGFLRSDKMVESEEWFYQIASKHNLHSDHLQLLKDICRYIADWHQSNRTLTLKGIVKLNTIPFFPPTWFSNKSRQSKSEGLSPSYLATFSPPYRLPDSRVPERWDVVFLKGVTVYANQKLDLDKILVHVTIPILGLTVHYDDDLQLSKLMFVMPKAKFGNLESHIEKEIPKDYLGPCQMALSITKDIKDLHWSFVHGNIHPRNILLNYSNNVGELVDVTFMKRNSDTSTISWAGRWPYVAPEVISTSQKTPTDIYALGIILWQLISRVSFPDDALVDPHVYRIEPIPGVLTEWQEIYIDCLNINPSKRPDAYTVHRRLTNIYTKLKQCPVPISERTLQYIQTRKNEIDHFLLSYRKMSLQELYFSPHATSNSESTSSQESKNTLYQVGDQVLTASVTRPSHQRLKSYPNLFQSFPYSS